MLEGYIVIVCLVLVFVLANAFIQEAHELKAEQTKQTKKATSVVDQDFSFHDPLPTPDSHPTKTPNKRPTDPPPTPTPAPAPTARTNDLDPCDGPIGY